MATDGRGRERPAGLTGIALSLLARWCSTRSRARQQRQQPSSQAKARLRN